MPGRVLVSSPYRLAEPRASRHRRRYKIKPRLYNRVVVLCIGINDYASPKTKDLSYAESDATALWPTASATLYGYETVLLARERCHAAAIGKRLREYREQLGEKDVLIVYFAGHGQVIELQSHGRAGSLVPQDADLDLDDRSDLDAGPARRWKCANSSRPRRHAHPPRAAHRRRPCCSGPS